MRGAAPVSLRLLEGEDPKRNADPSGPFKGEKFRHRGRCKSGKRGSGPEASTVTAAGKIRRMDEFPCRQRRFQKWTRTHPSFFGKGEAGFLGGSPAPVSSEEENRKQPGPKGRIRSRKEGENGGYPAGRQMDVEEKKVLKGRPDVRSGGKPCAKRPPQGKG
ncbi:MAG: hypothetical protein C6W57_07595 [Caldibacillus debilis]|mgnify:CR=1 FL=1|nr:hypothetical protein [Bacillaceae bacterium]OUM83571.1 MAG: hypothetical protein BAA03_08050 [Caldibacillus debilis]REJ16811.1 MAG: hypothetical protein C6W57_07595 [Caldibacillus debilis]REJ31035.1 MAG: hypothetical protein C6W56_01620 [Caldibacillus debilis]